MKTLKLWALIFAAMGLMAFGCGMACVPLALGFPEMVAKGYSGCSTCHVSPSGGGALTVYGRAVAEEISSVAPEGTGKLLGIIKQPDWFAVGGDTRHISVTGKEYHQKFLMQTDLELAVRPSREVWLAATGGMYGPKQLRQIRRYYVMWSPAPFLSMRFGRFYPSYGVMHPDHTLATRAGLGFGEGRETNNIEAFLHHKRGELSITGLFGEETDVKLTKDRGPVAKGEGVAVRLMAFPASTAHVGASYRFRRIENSLEHTAGPMVALGALKKLYLLGELARTWRLEKNQPRAKPVDVGMGELGYEVIRGIHLQTTYEFLGSNRQGYGMQWFLLPHTELNVRARVQDGQWVTNLLFHFYF